MLPSLFISHGSPQLVLMENQTTNFLKELSKTFDKPKYILVISAHWCTKELEMLALKEPGKLNDFYGFPKELYTQEYDAKSDAKQIEKVSSILNEHGIVLKQNSHRVGFDHGVWSPLKLIYPKADIPIIQLSLPLHYSIEELIALGEALQNLRDEMLIITSGSMTHNLPLMNWSNINAPVESYAKAFRDWMVEHLEVGNVEILKQFIKKAPYAQKNHPTLEHILPLFITVGTSKSKQGTSLHDVYNYGNLSMDTIIFKE